VPSIGTKVDDDLVNFSRDLADVGWATIAKQMKIDPYCAQSINHPYCQEQNCSSLKVL